MNGANAGSETTQRQSQIAQTNQDLQKNNVQIKVQHTGPLSPLQLENRLVPVNQQHPTPNLTGYYAAKTAFSPYTFTSGDKTVPLSSQLTLRAGLLTIVLDESPLVKRIRPPRSDAVG